MANPENIIPPKKGEVRNPKGKPKGTLNRSTLLKKWLAVQMDIKRPDTGDKEKMQLFDAITLAVIQKALKGDINAYKEIMDSIHGKVTDKVDHTTKGESIKPVTYEVKTYEQEQELKRLLNEGNGGIPTEPESP
jgi:hypothetical protein